MKRVLQFLPLALAFCLPRSTPAADSVVVFNEVHYHPPTNEAAGEWIELHNQMTIDIDLSAWRVSGDAAFAFAEGTIIPGGGYLVLAADPVALQAASGLTNVLGPFTGRLNNASGSLRLHDRNDRLMDSLDYRDGGKWPIAPDGSGATLAKLDPDSTSEEPEHWTSSVVSGGTPGRRNFPAAVATPRRGLVPFDALWRFEASGTDLGTSWRAPGFDDSAWSGRNRATLISYWPFDGSATAVRGANGALVGAVSTTADRNGLAGGALSFNGSLAQYVSVPGGGGLNGAVAGTVSMWVKWSGTQDADCCGSYGAVLARQANGLFSDNVLALNNPNPAVAVVNWRQSGAGAFLITGTTVVGTNWHHLAITFGPAGSVLYLDGAVQGGAVGPAFNNNASIPLTIGAWSGDGAGYSTSTIDDVAVWDQPLSAEQVGQLAAQTRGPLDFALPETAAYFAGNGRLAVNDELRHTALPLGPNTYYFRTTFQLADDPAQTELRLDLAVNDGAVFYLNGAEIYRHNMPPSPVSYSTPASSPIGDAPFLSDLPVPAGALVLGTNTLAVEVHQAGAGDPGMVFGAGLSGLVHLPVPSEERSLIGLNDVWKVEASNTDLGTAWRALGYADAAWSNAPALFWAGNGEVDGVPPELIAGVTAAASTEYIAGADVRSAMNTVNGSGLTGNAHGITPGGTMWLSHGTAVSPVDLNPQITFDLGNPWPLRLMKVWNYNEFLPGRPDLLARGVASGNILAGLATNALSPLLTGQTFNLAPGTVSDFSQAIDLGGVTARYVRLDQLTNFPGGDARFVGLSEVQFFRDANLKRTQLPLGPVTYYFRKAFNFGGDPAGARLFLNAAVDDGAVFYLNGVEVRRFNLAPGPVSHFTLATQSLAHATLSGPIEIAAASLRTGPNVLAVEVHQTAADSDQDMIFGASLTAQVSPPSAESFSPGTVVFNELTAGGSSFQVELINTGTAPVDLYGYTILRTGASADSVFTLPDSTLGPGEFLVLSQAMLGFGVVPGDKLFLFLPSLRGVADSVEVHERPRSRSPDGIGEWLTPTGVTLGGSNSVVRHDQVVINEIFYHGPPRLEAPAVLGTNTVISLTNVWRYEQSGTDLGTSWRGLDYDDSAWPGGRGLFFAGTNTLPAAKNTELALGPTTYYFRTTFVYSGAPAFQSASLRYAVDDGIVVYLNGRELARFNMPAGPISYTNNASGSIGIVLLRTPVNIVLTNFVIGTNVLAAEVHQAATSGDDMAFGVELNAVADAIPRIPFAESTEEWVELYNRGAQTADLTGWRLDEGIDYRFDPGTLIPPDGYLVVAKDPPALAEKFPGITIVGPYTNSLSHSGEKILLRDAADNPAYAVRYFDDGRWPDAPDGGGSSLELRDPRADPSAGEAWAASDELSRTGWRTYSYRAVAAASAVGPDGQWREFVLGMLGPGEVWLDDISVIETPATTPVQMLQNGTFDTGTNKWRIIGNHHGEVIDDPDQPGNKILRLVATGETEHMSNHAETTLANGRDTVNGREYLISFRARWISGSRQLHTRLYFNRLARTTRLDAPSLHGTPGSRNTAYRANIGPTYDGLRHEPAVPAPFAPVPVFIRASDPDGVAGLTLWSRVDGGSWASQPMTPAPAAAGPGNGQEYSAMLPGKPAGTIVQFYISGADGLGAVSLFPAAGTNSRALYQVDDGLAATNGLHNVRLVALTEDSDQLLRTVNLMSNERVGSTMIYDESEIFYDVGLRLKGSEHSRTTTPRLGFELGLNSAQKFRGVHHTVAIDRSESTGFGQREMLIHQTLNHAGGVPTKYHDLVQIMAPRPEYTGSAELQLARYTDVFLDDQYDHGSAGTVYEYELVYQLNSTDTGTPEGNKVPAPDSVTGTNIRNLGDDKEAYRWTYLIKNNEEKDDYARLMQFCKTMELSGTNFIAQITNIIEPEQWFRSIAVNALSGAGDSYGGDGAQHNVKFYVRPSDSRVIYFPHDVDAFFDVNRQIVPNADLSKMISPPAFARSYYGHVLDIIATTYNGNYLGRWANQFGKLLPAQDFAGHLAFIVQRIGIVSNQVLAAIPSANAAFSIANNGGNNFGTTNDTITLTGTAPLSVKEIQVNGVRYPVTWTTTAAWSLRLPLLAGENFLTVQGVAYNGRRLSNAVDTITVTNSSSGAPLPVVINEWMADNAWPFGYPDPMDGLYQDWFELYNPNTNAVNLSGFTLTDNLGLPTKWTIPVGTIIQAQGYLLVWADNEPAQNALDPNGNLHAAFQLNNSGEAIGLFTPAGVAQHVVTFERQFQNVSAGLYPDGATNAVYFMTNFTPRAANTLADRLHITHLEFNGGGVLVSWAAIPGRFYRVDYKDALNAPTWTPLADPVQALGATASALDAPAPATRRFYRIVLLD